MLSPERPKLVDAACFAIASPYGSCSASGGPGGFTSVDSGYAPGACAARRACTAGVSSADFTARLKAIQAGRDAAERQLAAVPNRLRRGVYNLPPGLAEYAPLAALTVNPGHRPP